MAKKKTLGVFLGGFGMGILICYWLEIRFGILSYPEVLMVGLSFTALGGILIKRIKRGQ